MLHKHNLRYSTLNTSKQDSRLGVQKTKVGMKKDFGGKFNFQTLTQSYGTNIRSNDMKTFPINKNFVKIQRKSSIKQDFYRKSSVSIPSGAHHMITIASVPETQKSRNLFTEDDFDNTFDLRNEEAWASISSDQMPVGFKQYRMLTRKLLMELENELEILTRRTDRKLESVKTQYQEEKKKWQMDRKKLVESLEEEHMLRMEADIDTQMALTHFEGIVNVICNNQSLQVTNLSEEEDDAEVMVEPERLEKMTDDAKAEMSRESTKILIEPQQNENETTMEKEVTMTFEPLLAMDEEVNDMSMLRSRATWSHQHHVEELHKYQGTLSALKHRMDERRKTNTIHAQFVFDRKKETMDFEEDAEKMNSIIISIDANEISFQAKDDEKNEMIGDEKSRRSMTPQHMINAVIMVEEFLKTHNSLLYLHQSLTGYHHLQRNDLLLRTSVERIDFEKDGSQISFISQNIQRMLHDIEDCINLLLQQQTDERRFSIISSVSAIKNRTLDDDAGHRSSILFENSTELDKHLTNDNETIPLQPATATGDDFKSHCEMLRNTVIVSEMQDTIVTLKKELSSLRMKANDIIQQEKPTSSSSELISIFFTRLDSERNSKIMTKALEENKMNAQQCQRALQRMDQYVEMPSRQLQCLVKKYLYYKNIQEIEKTIKKQSTDGYNNDLLNLLTKMSFYQRKRYLKCDEKSQRFSQERNEIAKELMSILVEMEMESGIFLIKPMLYLKERFDPNAIYFPKRTRMNHGLKEKLQQIHHHPHLTNSTDNNSFFKQARRNPFNVVSKTGRHLENGILQGVSKPLIGGGGGGDQMKPMWKSDSRVESIETATTATSNIPHLLEMDVNRITIPNNNISLKIPVNSVPQNTRTYTIKSRQQNGIQSSGNSLRSISVTGLTSVPPTTPMYAGGIDGDGKRFHLSGTACHDHSGSTQRHLSSPLPPITTSFQPSFSSH